MENATDTAITWMYRGCLERSDSIFSEQRPEQLTLNFGRYLRLC